MATHKLGKLKFNWSKNGLAFRFGEGKIHRIGLGKKQGEADDSELLYEGEYMDAEEQEYTQDEYTQEEYEAEGYSGRFAQPSGGVAYEDDYEDGYEDGYDEYDDGYQDEYDDREYDDGYQDEYDDREYDDGYQDEYDDREYDDGYDDEYDDGYYDERGYDDDGYYDEEGEYDDRYSDEDAGGYDDMPYEEEGPVMRFINEHIWVIYILLVLLPPLGIYLLWNRGLFEKPIRIAISIVSAVLFAVIIWFIIWMIPGRKETTIDPQMVLTTPTPTVEAAATADPSGVPSFSDDMTVDDLLNSSGADIGDIDSLLKPDATATPLPGGNVGSTGDEGAAPSGDTVFVTAAGGYYHKNRTCANINGASVSIVTLPVAEQQSKTACPLCYPNQEEYYATKNGKYYHTDPNCSGMENASLLTKDAVVQAGKAACPVCVTKQINSMSSTGLKYADGSTQDRSGMTVYATSGGTYFHVNPTCSGMRDAMSGSLLKAMLAGKKACPTCCSAADDLVWCTKGGTYYHSVSNCSGMEGANQVMLAEALCIGKDRCPKCYSGTAGTSINTPAVTEPTGVLVYATKNGTYYHTKSDCSGMTGASRYTLLSMIQTNRPPCPVCASSANTLVFASSGGTYYHSNATCSGMKNAKSGTLAQALAVGLQRCPSCWTTSDDGMNATVSVGGTAGAQKVYATKNGSYYHSNNSCSGMVGAAYGDLTAAVAMGKKACPVCILPSTSGYNVYSVDGQQYYHLVDNCSGMTGAKQRPIEEAQAIGQTACPTCQQLYQSMKNSGQDVTQDPQVNTPALTDSGIFKSGTSGISVYATPTSQHYHTNATCSGMQNASLITLETALNYGKTGCNTCAASANTAVYAVMGGRYYHYDQACAGSGAAGGTTAAALAYGFEACPVCVTKTQQPQQQPQTNIPSTNVFTPGTSGLKVYASVSGTYYHKDANCAGSGASSVTLETALNYGKQACPSCIGGAATTVYSSGGDQYYHSSQACAGSGAIAGQFAQALALGKKECPICIGGSEAYEESDIQYAAPADTKVYIDPTRDLLYYHAGPNCNDAGLSGGVGGNLEFALEWGYRACPFCNPPTHVN